MVVILNYYSRLYCSRRNYGRSPGGMFQRLYYSLCILAPASKIIWWNEEVCSDVGSWQDPLGGMMEHLGFPHGLQSRNSEDWAGCYWKKFLSKEYYLESIKNKKMELLDNCSLSQELWQSKGWQRLLHILLLSSALYRSFCIRKGCMKEYIVKHCYFVEIWHHRLLLLVEGPEEPLIQVLVVQMMKTGQREYKWLPKLIQLFGGGEERMKEGFHWSIEDRQNPSDLSTLCTK